MIEQQSAETIAILKTIDFGAEVKAFLGTNIGKYLVAKAEGEVADAVEELKTVSPSDPVAIADLQNRVYRAESFQYWLAEAIQTGQSVEYQFTNPS